MKLAFSKPTRSREAQQLLFSRYPEFGFDGLQLKGNQYGDYVGVSDGAAKFRDDWGSEPGHSSSVITMNPLDDSGVDRLRALFQFAAGAGSERVVICHDVPREGLNEADLVGFAQKLSGLADEAQELGVRLSLHHHAGEPVMHRHDFDVFFGAVSSDNLRLTVDTGHLIKSGITDIAELITSFTAVIDNIHLKDYADGQFQLLGRGELELAPVLATFAALRPDTTLCVDEESKAEIEEGLEVSKEYLQKNLITA